MTVTSFLLATTYRENTITDQHRVLGLQCSQAHFVKLPEQTVWARCEKKKEYKKEDIPPFFIVQNTHQPSFITSNIKPPDQPQTAIISSYKEIQQLLQNEDHHRLHRPSGLGRESHPFPPASFSSASTLFKFRD